MPFRVVVTGPHRFRDYPHLRAALDAALVNRLPDVVLLSGCGPGTDFQAASYAHERGLPITPYPMNFARFSKPDEAAADRNARLVADADAAVIVWDRIDRQLEALIVKLRGKGVLVRVVTPDADPGTPPPEPQPDDDRFRGWGWTRILPD